MENRQSQKLIVEQIITELAQSYPMDTLRGLKEYFSDQCDNMRMTLLRDHYTAFRYIDQSFYQLVPCDESVITCHEEECVIEGITFSAETNLYEIDLPHLVTGVEDHNIKSISDRLNTFTFYRVGFSDFVNYNSEYMKPGPICTVIGNKMYLRNLPTKGMTFVNIWLLAASPRSTCGWRDTDFYPTPSVYKLKLLVKKDFLSTRPSQQVNKPVTDDSKKENT